MASQLEQQLRSIAVAAGVRQSNTQQQASGVYDPVAKQKGKASLVYSFQEAADVGIDVLYDAGVKGFDQLCRLDPRFAQCRKRLFSSGSRHMELHQLDEGARAAVDKAIDVFCMLLSPYFLLPAATHALEYLVRKFEIHERNVSSLMKAILPYHETAEFTRCVMIARVHKTVFEFLSPLKKSPTPLLTREKLVQRCVTDRALLRFVCDMARDGSDPTSLGVASCMGWYAVLVCEYLSVVEASIDEECVGFFLPYILHGVKGHVLPEYRDATYMIVGQMGRWAQFGHEMLHGLVCDIASTCTPGSLPRIMLLLSHLATSQPAFVSFPRKAFDFLARLPNVIPELGRLTTKIPLSRKFGYLFLVASIERALKNDTSVYDGVVKSVELGEYASSASAVLLNMAKQPLQGEEQDRLVQMLKHFDLHHSNATEAAINDFLSQSDKDSPERAHVLVVVGKSLEDTVRAPLENANVTLASGIDHSSASIRIAALEKLNDICSAEGGLKEEAEIILKTGLERRIQDDDVHVVAAVLGLSELSRLLPEGVLTDNLIQCIDRCMKEIYTKTSTKKTRSISRNIVKAALGLLPRVSKNQELVLGALLSVLFTAMGSYKVSIEALRILAEYKSPLSSYCARLSKEYGEHPKSHTPKRVKKSDQPSNESDLFDVNKFNKDVVNQLSDMVLKDSKAYMCLLSILESEAPRPYAQASILYIFENSISRNMGKKETKGEAIAVDLVKWFFKGHALTINEQRRVNQGFKSSWDSKAGSLTDQSLMDVATRISQVCSIEPEVILVSLQSLSKGSIRKLDKPTLVELYAYLASLPQSVWRQHIDVLVDNMNDPVADLSQLWSSNDSGDSEEVVITSALDQWVAFVSTQKLTEAQKKLVLSNITGILHLMSSASEGIRTKGLTCCEELQKAIKSWWPGKSTVSMDTILSLLEACSKNKERIQRDSDGLEYLLRQAVANKSVSSRKKAKSPRSLEAKLAFVDSEGLSSFFLMELADTCSRDQISTIPLLIRILEVSSNADKLSTICSEVLDNLFYDIEKEEFESSLDSVQLAAALEILNVFQDANMYHHKSQNPDQILQSVILAAQWKMHADLREVALRALVNSAIVSPGHTSDIVRVLMTGASSESEESCRNAALEALERIKIQPEILLPFLKLPTESQRKKKKSSEPTSGADASITLCLHTLELLQWKKDVPRMELFVQPLQVLIKEFGLLLEDGKNSFNDDTTLQGPAVSAYGLRLSLSILLEISDNDTEGITKSLFDTATIVDCASSASDHAVRSAALELLRSRIESNPEDSMDHIIKTVETICRVLINQKDKYSTSLAAQVMSTAAAAWMGGGNSMHDLVSNVIDAIKETSIGKKYAILSSIIDSMPGNAAKISASITYHLLLSNDGSNADSWKPDAAFSMISKRKKMVCVSASGYLLQLCISPEQKKYRILLEANAIVEKILQMYCKSFQRIQNDDQLFESYEMIIQSVLYELQTIGKIRAKNSDPYLLDIENSAYKVLDALKNAMSHVHFINSLIRSLSHKYTTDQMKRKSLMLIMHILTDGMSDEATKDAALHQCIHDAVGTIVSIIKDKDGQSEMSRQIALETLSSFVKRFGAQYHEIFLQAISPTIDLVTDTEVPGVRGMALVSIASFISSMKSAIIPMLPQIIECIISGSKSGLESDVEEQTPEMLDLSASLTALQALCQTLASFLAPKMADILQIVLHENVVSSPDPKMEALGHACRDGIAMSVPARLLTGPLSDVLNKILDDHVDQKNTLSILMMLKILAAMISRMDSTEVATYSGSVFSMILKGLDIRRTWNSSSPSDIYDIESASVSCMLQLVLKLNESKFKPLFFRLLEWATTSPAGEACPSDARKIAFFNVINILTENLKSIFTSYFNPVLNSIREIISDSSPGQGEKGEVVLLQLVTMRALARCFMYDTSGFLNETTFEKLLDPLVHLLTHESTSLQEITTDESRLKEEYGIGEDVVINAILSQSPGWMKETLGIFTQTVIACMSQMTTASGMGNNGEARWRPLHHAVLMATRSHVADSRCAALEIVLSICNTLQEEYLTLLPEALPFLSELLEDEDSRVEKRTVEVLKTMETVSGEDLKQYLTSAQ